MTSDVVFRDPWWLLALLALPLALRWRRLRPVLVGVVPFAAAWHRPSATRRSWLALGATVAAFVLLVFALARPQRIQEKREIKSEGYDIMLAIDLSASMLAEDYERDGHRINRLQALQPLIDAFIARRPHDRVGVVVFSGRAYTLAPLTFDHAWLARQLARVKIGAIEEGTAIGDGVATALTRLQQASRVASGGRPGAFVVLMTDGASNRGLFAPMEAAAAARQQGVPVYAISIGTDGYVEMPVVDAAGHREYRAVQSDVDEGTLWKMTQLTGGKFFHGGSSGTIERAFTAIDEARKIEFQARTYFVNTELFPRFLWPGALLLAFATTLTLLPRGVRERCAAEAEHAVFAARGVAHVGAAICRRQVRHWFI